MNQDKGQNPNDAWITVDAGFSQEIWLPEIEIMDVKVGSFDPWIKFNYL